MLRITENGVRRISMVKTAPKWKDISFLILFALSACFIFWKCPYGFGSLDESFVLTVPFRLVQGDGLFANEWHLSQMAGFIAYPFVYVFLKLNGNTEGIILAFRYIYAFIQCITSLYVYHRLKKYNWIGAITATICILIYTPYNIMTLSYNTLGIICLLISVVTVATAQKCCKTQYTIAGVFYALAVLCCPFLVFVFLGYVLFVFILKPSKKQSLNQFPLFDTTCTIFMTVGAIITAVMFFIFVFSRTSLSQFFESFSWILNDPEHTFSLIKKIAKYFYSVLTPNILAPFVYLLFGILYVVYLRDKAKNQHRHYYFIAAVFITLLLFAGHLIGKRYVNYMMWPINTLAFVVFVLTKNKNIQNLFYTMWIPGMLYGFCINMASNQTYYVISSASSVATVGSILMVAMFVKEISSEITSDSLKKVCSIAVASCFAIQLLSVGILRYKMVFFDTDIHTQTEYIDRGSQAGLIVSEQKYSEYCQDEEKMAIIAEYKPEKVLFLTTKTSFYLMSNYEMATFSAWLSGVNSYTIEKLLAYYEFNPDKLPDIVYAEAEDELFIDELGQALNMKKNSTKYGFILTK